VNNWTLHYKPGPFSGSWTLAELQRFPATMSLRHAIVYMDIYSNYPTDTVIYAENKNGKRIYPNKLTKALSTIITTFGG